MKSISDSDGAADLTCDSFLGGKLRIWQTRKGYRAGADPVFLAAAVPAARGQSVLELGCGVGVASLCLAGRVGGLELAAIEIDPLAAKLAKRNAMENGVPLEVFEGDLSVMPQPLRSRSFDHVMANPPFFPAGTGTGSLYGARATGRIETASLEAWVDAATRRLTPGGTLTIIQRADRLADLLRAMDSRLGGAEVKPLAARAARPAQLVVVRARKGSRAPFRLCAPLVLHEGERHESDGESYTRAAQAVLREGAPLEFL